MKPICYFNFIFIQLSFGWGVLGQLGLGHCHNAITPTKIEGLTNVVHISAGGMHSGAIDSCNKCYTWGCNDYGQLGLAEALHQVVDDCSTKPPTPPPAHEGSMLSVNRDYPNWNKIVSSPKQVFILYGSSHSSTAVEDTLADASTEESEKSLKPLLLKRLSCGGMHSGGIGVDGKVWTWGRADSGQIGYSAKKLLALKSSMIIGGTIVPTPYHVKFVEHGESICCGGFHTSIVDINGVAYTMGKDDFGMLGTSVANIQSAGMDRPTVVNKLEGIRVVDVACGGWHTMFVSNHGDVYACGKGEYGRLGVDGEQSHRIPELLKIKFSNPLTSLDGNGESLLMFPSDTDSINLQPRNDSCSNTDDGEYVVKTSAGGSHTMFLTNKGNIYCCGRTDNGRLGCFNSSDSVNNSPRANDQPHRIRVPTKLDMERFCRYSFITDGVNPSPIDSSKNSPKPNPNRIKHYHSPSKEKMDVSMTSVSRCIGVGAGMLCGMLAKKRAVDLSAGGSHSLVLLNDVETLYEKQSSENLLALSQMETNKAKPSMNGASSVPGGTLVPASLMPTYLFPVKVGTRVSRSSSFTLNNPHSNHTTRSNSRLGILSSASEIGVPPPPPPLKL